MSNETVQVLVVGSFQAEVALVNVIDSLVVHHERAFRVLKSCVCGEDGVVWLNNRGGGLRSRIDTELKLALLAIVNRETLHKKSTETRSSSTTE